MRMRMMMMYHCPVVLLSAVWMVNRQGQLVLMNIRMMRMVLLLVGEYTPARGAWSWVAADPFAAPRFDI